MRRPLVLSLVAHLAILAVLIFVPLFWPDLPQLDGFAPGVLRVTLYDAPPPPPPPLPRGRPELKPRPPAPTGASEKPEPRPEGLTAPVEVPARLPEPEAGAPERQGSLTGHDLGDPLGDEEGVLGGEVGGVPGGTLGGVIGGTGTGEGFDVPPRPIRITKPQYPQQAFVDRVEGVVTLEVLIGVSGRVERARVLRSTNHVLDGAALACVRDWLFIPAVSQGRTVPVVAEVPITFRIY